MEVKFLLKVDLIDKDACGQCGVTGLLHLCGAIILIPLPAFLPFFQSRDLISF